MRSPAKASAEDAAPLKQKAPAPQDKEAAPAAVLADTKDPKNATASAAHDDEDLDISDEEGSHAEGDGSEVDEDWGGDWE